MIFIDPQKRGVSRGGPMGPQKPPVPRDWKTVAVIGSFPGSDPRWTPSGTPRDPLGDPPRDPLGDPPGPPRGPPGTPRGPSGTPRGPPGDPDPPDPPKTPENPSIFKFLLQKRIFSHRRVHKKCVNQGGTLGCTSQKGGFLRGEATGK